MPYRAHRLLALCLSLAACGGPTPCSSDCPSDDAGTGTADSGARDSGGADSGICATCIRVTITNGMATAPSGVTLDFEGTAVPLPAFGVTTPFQSVDIGSDGTLTVTSPFLVAGAIVGLVPGRSYDWVLAGTPDAIRVLALPDLYTTTTGGISQVTVANLTDIDIAAGVGATPPGPVPAQNAGDHLSAAFDASAPLVITRADGHLLAGFAWSALGDAHLYGALVGDPDLPLSSPAGLRLVPVVPGASAQEPLPLFYALNGTASPLVVCDATGMLASVASRALAGPFVGTVDATTGVHFARDACDATNAHAVSAGAAGAWLYAALGDASGADPSAWSLAEVAADPGLYLVNGTGASADYTTTGGAPTLTRQVVAAGTTHSGSLTTAPSAIEERILDGGGGVTSDLSFAWSPRGRAEVGVFVGTDAASYAALEVDLPPGAPAVLTAAVP